MSFVLHIFDIFELFVNSFTFSSINSFMILPFFAPNSNSRVNGIDMIFFRNKFSFKLNPCFMRCIHVDTQKKMKASKEKNSL